MLTKGGFVVASESPDSASTTRRLAYVFESLVHRTVESNDGVRVVEVRHFENLGMVKLLVDAEEISLDLGSAREGILKPRGLVVENEAPITLPAKQVGNAILSAATRKSAESPHAQAFGCAHSLSGKTVRISYADGVGVETVEPIGCTLTEADVQLLMHTPVLANCYLLPRPESGPALEWTVNARQFVGLVELGQRVVPIGEIELQMDSDQGSSDTRRVAVQIQDESECGLLHMDGIRGFVGSQCVEGNMVYQWDEDFVRRIELCCRVEVYHVSQDWFLFGEVFSETPMMTVSYDCWKDEGMTRPRMELCGGAR
jgi:hypothetical protein